MADAFLEVTKWGEHQTPNHIYLLDDDKAYAYLKHGETVPFYFSKPLQIEKTGRKFVKLDVNPFKPVEEEVNAGLIAVAGSGGATYYVDPKNKTCTCTGFKFRGKCKHVEAL